MKQKNFKNNKSGFVILFAVTISAILLAIALGVSNIALKEINFSTSARDTNDAFFAADTGAECALYYERSDFSPAKFPEGGPASSPINCAGANSTVTYSGGVFSFNIVGLGSTGQSCAKVTVDKTTPTVKVVSKGYNIGNASCVSSSTSLLERQLEFTYDGGGSGSGSPSNYDLTVNPAGTGTGTVTSNPSGINCGSTCSASFASGTPVTLTAAANSGSTFAGWSGAGCSGTGSCVATMSSNQSVTATFNLTVSSFPVIVATNSSTQTADTLTHVVNLPAGISSGNLLIVFFAVDSLPTVSCPAGWTQLFTGTSGASGDTFLGCYKVATGSEGATVNFTTSNVQKSAHQSFLISGYTGLPQATSANNTTGSINPNSPSLAPTWGSAKTLWISAVGRGAGTNVTTTAYPGSYTNGTSVRSGADSTGASQDTAIRSLQAASEDPGAFTVSASQIWVAATVGIQGL